MANKIRATVKERKNQIRARSSVTVFRRLEDFDNITAEGVQDGSVLVYNAVEETWEPTVNLNKQNVDAGEF